MKKILSLLASIGLVATSSSFIVSCGTSEKAEEKPTRDPNIFDTSKMSNKELLDYKKNAAIELKALDDKRTNLEVEISNTKLSIKSCDLKTADIDKQIDKNKSNINTNDKLIEEANDHIEKLNAEIDNKNKDSLNKGNEIKNLENDIVILNKLLDYKHNEIKQSELNDKISQLFKTNNELSIQYNDLKEYKDNYINYVYEHADNLEDEVNKLREEISSNKVKIETYEETIKDFIKEDSESPMIKVLTDKKNKLEQDNFKKIPELKFKEKGLNDIEKGYLTLEKALINVKQEMEIIASKEFNNGKNIQQTYNEIAELKSNNKNLQEAIETNGFTIYKSIDEVNQSIDGKNIGISELKKYISNNSLYIDELNENIAKTSEDMKSSIDKIKEFNKNIKKLSNEKEALISEKKRLDEKIINDKKQIEEINEKELEINNHLDSVNRTIEQRKK